MPSLLLGPCLRYVGENCAVIWVETDQACEVAVLDQCARTFHVEGHHYGILIVEGLSPATVYPYQVVLDGAQVWPPSDSRFPASTIRTLNPDTRFSLVFGSCRVAAPQEIASSGGASLGTDALAAYGLRMMQRPEAEIADALVMLGDQVYADDVPAQTRKFLQSRRDTSAPPFAQVADFEEYTRLYRDSWSDPVVAWVLSTVPTAMIFDDHDVHDDWNTSGTWVAQMRARPWWDARIVGGLISYWLYQHLGNLSPDTLRDMELLAQVQAADDGGPILREFVRQADRDVHTARWSYRRDFGGTRLIVIDSRCGRIVDEVPRKMVDDAEFAWIEEQATGDFDHLLLATSVPWLLAPGLHDFEAWTEAVCAGAWGRPMAWVGEALRQAMDTEHWAAFGDSFQRLTALVRAVAGGDRGAPPASVTVLSGDVHHAYLAKAEFPGAGTISPVYQAVCSPMRNAVPTPMKAAFSGAASRVGQRFGQRLARRTAVDPPAVDWTITDGPWFDNQIATLEIAGRQAVLRLERAGDDGQLATLLETRLSE